jgi:hypothetical protein
LLGSLSSSRAQLDLLEQFTSTSSSINGMQVNLFSLQINDMFRRQKSTVRCTRYRHICLDKAHVQSDYVANFNFLCIDQFPIWGMFPLFNF